MEKRNGFTLLEIVLYIAFAAILFVALATFSQTLLRAANKQKTISDIEEVGTQTLARINASIRNAVSVTIPIIGTTSSLLSLEVINPVKNPTLFFSSSSVLYIQEGTNAPVALFGPSLAITETLFQNRSRANTTSTIRTEFFLQHKNTTNRNEFDYQKQFFGSATLRN